LNAGGDFARLHLPSEVHFSYTFSRTKSLLSRGHHGSSKSADECFFYAVNREFVFPGRATGQAANDHFSMPRRVFEKQVAGTPPMTASKAQMDSGGAPSEAPPLDPNNFRT
jgi:hypothetical protein